MGWGILLLLRRFLLVLVLDLDLAARAVVVTRVVRALEGVVEVVEQGVQMALAVLPLERQPHLALEDMAQAGQAVDRAALALDQVLDLKLEQEQDLGPALALARVQALAWVQAQVAITAPTEPTAQPEYPYVTQQMAPYSKTAWACHIKSAAECTAARQPSARKTLPH